MRKKSDYEAEAKAIGAENIQGIGAADAESGKMIFKAKGKVSTVQGTKNRWTPVYLEAEDGTTIRFSAKALMSAKGLKFPSGLGAERLASIEQACENGLEVEYLGATKTTVKPRVAKGQDGWFEPYDRYALEFEKVEMPEPTYEEGEE